jgi:hypothetical protein
VAAGVGVGAPLVGLDVRLRMHRAQVEPVALAQVLGEPLGLGEQVTGVEEHDVGVGDRLADQVDEHGVAEAGGHDQPVTELLAGPAQDLGRVGFVEHHTSQSNPD